MGQPHNLQNALLDDAFTMVEHGKMGLSEALKMGLSFVKMYKDSPSFELISKRLESDHLHKSGVIQRLDGIIQSNQARR
jgi:hypothetical protein